MCLCCRWRGVCYEWRGAGAHEQRRCTCEGRIGGRYPGQSPSLIARVLSLIAALVRAIKSALSARERLRKRKGGSGGRGVKRAAPTHSGRSLRPSTQEAAAIPFAHVVLDLRARGRRLASVRAKMGCAWCGLVRGKGGEGAAVGCASRGSTMATAAAASETGARLGGAGGRGAGGVHRMAGAVRERRVSRAAGVAGVLGVQLAAPIGGVVRRGERERERKMHENLDGGVRQNAVRGSG